VAGVAVAGQGQAGIGNEIVPIVIARRLALHFRHADGVAHSVGEVAVAIDFVVAEGGSTVSIDPTNRIFPAGNAGDSIDASTDGIAEGIVLGIASGVDSLAVVGIAGAEQNRDSHGRNIVARAAVVSVVPLTVTNAEVD